MKQKRTRVHPVQEFNGVRYYRTGKGYYKGENRYMHRVVWEHHRGAIPFNYCVHHSNHDRADNRIENLELMTKNAHASLHSTERAAADPERARQQMRDYVHPAAAKWHGSEAGLIWHSSHGKQTWVGREKVERTCAHCGSKFMGYALHHGLDRGYCKPYCQHRARLLRGDDDETRWCVWCHKEFRIDRYSPTRACSQSCAGKVAAAKRLGRWVKE